MENIKGVNDLLMKDNIKKTLSEILEDLYSQVEPEIKNLKISIQDNKEKEHGDLATNIAMVLAKPLKKNPKEIAEEIKQNFVLDEKIIKIEVAGPGFLNFFLSKDSYGEILEQIQKENKDFGKSDSKQSKVLIEYVSSNPTGPLHVGHGRGAVFGSVLSSLLEEAGFEVDQEYYVNDFGRQMNILAASVWIRYCQLFSSEIKMMQQGYQGDYLLPVAKKLKDEKSDSLFKIEESLIEKLNSEDQDDEFTDQLVESLRVILKEEFQYIREFALSEILHLIKADLEQCGVHHNAWFSESSLYGNDGNTDSKVDGSIEELKSRGFIYEEGGAIWFKSSSLGDDKDRVLKRGNGEYTYFASDVAYHLDKYDRGYDRVINVWGSDHHGYLPRVRAAMDACDRDINKLEVIFIQFANLVKAGKKVSMSTRSGDFITLNELMNEVTTEAARFFYINRKADQHLEFDLDLAKEQSKDNPLYYIQYAHARICSVLRKAENEFEDFDSVELALLGSEKEIEILKLLRQYPQLIERSAKAGEPHLLCYFLRDLSGVFHSYYNSEKVLIEDKELMTSRLFLLKGVKQVIANGLRVLGIKAPEEM
ncbi:MAG: arginine--tRNA ligase [Gammaproteobacteria bacterium]